MAVGCSMFAATLMAQQNADVVTVNAAAVITSGIAITKTADLVFGDIVADPASAGTVVVSPAGSRSGTVVTFGGRTFNNASFDVTRSGSGNPHFTVTLPTSVNISNGASTMVVDNFTSNYPAPPPAQSAPFTLNVGATLHVGASQPVGTYTGIFTVTVVQQ